MGQYTNTKSFTEPPFTITGPDKVTHLLYEGSRGIGTSVCCKFVKGEISHKKCKPTTCKNCKRGRLQMRSKQLLKEHEPSAIELRMVKSRQGRVVRKKKR